MSKFLLSGGLVVLFSIALALPAQGEKPPPPKETTKEEAPSQDKDAAREIQNSVYLGIFTVPLRSISNRVKHGLNIKDDDGVIIVEVLPDSPAAEAGLREKDTITRINGKAIADQASLCVELNRRGAGQNVTVSILRKGEKHDIVARLQEATPEVITFSAYLGSETSGPAEKAAGAARESNRRIQALERQISRLEKRLNDLEKAQLVRKP